MKKFLKGLGLFVLGAVFLSTVFAAWRSTNWSSYDMLANRFLFTSGGTLSGDYILDTNSGGTIIAYGPLVDGGLNAYITGGDYVTLADSGVYFDANSGTYFETNSGIYFEANSGTYFETNSGTYFEANSGTYYTTNPSGYITGGGTLWNLVNPGGVVRILTPKDTTNYLGINVGNGNSVSQIGSSVIGTNNTLAGDYGFIAGSSCTNSASNTTTLGFKLNNNTQYNVALGKYNVGYTSGVLEVGYGAIESTRANFLTVFKDGSTWLTAKDMAGNAYITGGAISGSYVTIADSGTYFETNSGTYFLANSGTYYDSNPAGFIASIGGNDGDLCVLSGTTVFCDVTPTSGLVETDPIWTAASGVYFNLNSGTYFEANSGTYFLANSGAYYDSNPAGFITGGEISGNYVTLANSGAYYTTNPLGYLTGGDVLGSITDGSTDGLVMFSGDGSLMKPNAYLNRGANVGLTNSTVGGVGFSAMTLYDLSNATGTGVSSTANLYTFRGTALNVAKAGHTQAGDESVPISRIFSTMTIANSGGYEQSSPYLQIDAPTRGIGDLIQMFKNDVKKFWVDSTGDTHISGDLYPEKIVNRVSVVANAASLTPEGEEDIYQVTALSETLEFINSTTTIHDGTQIKIRVIDDGTGQTLTRGTGFLAKGGIALPSTTVTGKQMVFGLEWFDNLTGRVLLAFSTEV